MNIKKKKECEQCDQEVKLRNVLRTHRKQNTGMAWCEECDSEHESRNTRLDVVLEKVVKLVLYGLIS